MKSKGQFMIVSAVIASLIVISLSSAISNIQLERYQTSTLPEDLAQIKSEIRKVTEDGSITAKEERNFRKMLGYLEKYETTATIRRGAADCIQVTVESADRRIQMPCIN